MRFFFGRWKIISSYEIDGDIKINIDVRNEVQRAAEDHSPRIFLF